MSVQHPSKPEHSDDAVAQDDTSLSATRPLQSMDTTLDKTTEPPLSSETMTAAPKDDMPGDRARKAAERLAAKLAQSERSQDFSTESAKTSLKSFVETKQAAKTQGPRISAVTGLEKRVDPRRPLERNLAPNLDQTPKEPESAAAPTLPKIASFILFPFKAAWRTSWGGLVSLLSLLWLGAALYYLDLNFGLHNTLQMLPHELGMFVAGVSAPLVLVWFAFAYYKQSRALTAQLRALAKTSEQSSFQAETMTLTERHLRLDSVLNLSEFYLNQMAKEAAILANHTFHLNKQEEEALWGRFAQGDQEIFFRLFFERPDGQLAERMAKVIIESDLAAKSAHLFSGHYQVFIRHGESIDRGNLMLEAYKQGYLGDLSRIVNKALYGSENPFSQ